MARAKRASSSKDSGVRLSAAGIDSGYSICIVFIHFTPTSGFSPSYFIIFCQRSHEKSNDFIDFHRSPISMGTTMILCLTLRGGFDI
jgi:hypothetical protein